jgi:glyceraldehyde 3-phosphate dehydrogenase
VGGQRVAFTQGASPGEVAGEEHGADVVLECSGAFRTIESLAPYFERGVRKVVVAAPGKDDRALNVVVGVNDDRYDPVAHDVVTAASCTTNCLAPVAKVLHQRFGITMGIMTTIHSYTNDQEILDLPHKDLRRGRAAALSMIPTSTGAAQAVGLVLPELKGKFDGISVRVPTPNVSLVDLTFHTEKSTSVDEINDALREAANGALKGILAYSDEQLVSIDFNHNAHSSIVDTTFTRSVNPQMHKILAWYDNEWGYSNRILDLIAHVVRVKKGALAAR